MTEMAVSVRLKADGSGLVGELRVSKAELDKLAAAAKGAGKEATDAGRKLDNSGKDAKKAAQGAKEAGRAFNGLRAAMASAAAAFGISDIIRTNREYDRLRGVLVTLTGSSAAANKEFKRLQDFAAKTPFDLKQVVEAFARLQSVGLDPSTRALRSYGNTAAAMGRDVMQFVEAVADATTGEFERLKDFGIKAAVEGSKVTFSFRGVETEVKKSAHAIEEYLLRIGETDFASGMDEQANRLTGILSNLGDSFDKFKVSIGDGGFSAALKEVASGLSAAADGNESLAREIGATLGALTTGLAGIVSVAAQNLDIVVSLTGAYLTYRTTVLAAEAATALFNRTLALSPLGLIATGLSAVVGGLILYNQRSREAVNIEKDRATALERIANAQGGTLSSDDKKVIHDQISDRRRALRRLEGSLATLEKGGTTAGPLVDKIRNQVAAAKQEILDLQDLLAGKTKAKTADAPGVITLGLGKSEKDKIISDYEDVAAALDPVMQRQLQLAEATGKLKAAFAAGVIDQGTFDRLKALAETKFAAPDATKWMDEQAKASQEQLRLLGLSVREREIEEETIRRVNAAKKDGVDIEGENLEIVRRQVEAEYDVAEAAEKRREAQKRAVDEFNKIWENAVENAQRTVADKLDDAFHGRINSIKDLWKSFRDIGLRAIAETSAALIFSGGKIPEGSSLGGLAGVLADVFGKKRKKHVADWDGIRERLDMPPLPTGTPPYNPNEPGPKNPLGSFGVGLKDAFTQVEELLKPLAEGLKKTFKPLFESFGKTFKGVFGRSVGEAFGRAFGGAGVGTMVAGIGKALGINLNNTGAQVGGAIGSFIPIPGGNLIGSVIGGLVGKLFGGKTPVARASFSTGVADPDTYKRGKADTGVAVGLVGAARQSLEQIASTLGGGIVEGLDLGGLGTRKKKYVFDPVGQGKKFGKNKSTRYNTAEEATAAAVQYALEHDAIAGLSQAASRVLKQFKDVNVGLREATKVVNLERFIDSFTNPFKTAAKEFELQAAERIKVARNYGFDVVEIERLNAKEREKFIAATLEQTTGSVKRLLEDLQLGGRAEGSAVERRAALLAERDQLAAKAQGGDTSVLDRLAEVSAQLLDASEEAFGSTQQFAADRAATTSLLQSLLNETETRIKAAQEEAKAAVATATNPQLTEANQSLDDIANGVGQLLAEFVRLRQAVTGTSTTAAPAPTAISADVLARIRAGAVRF